MKKFFDSFKIQRDKEEIEAILENISNDVVFRGANLWILIFAIFVASLGLNVNSTAVIIGAMLISPLMGPIMGIGLGIGVNDSALLRKALYNFLVASGVALTTSTVFFLVSPINDAHSEILARISPNIYDVLIALFGGLAGIVAAASKQKGNVIPGVAIATALMPPLCTAGYGLATLQYQYFFGALYLFIINTVFIAFATFIVVRLLRFPYTRLQDAKGQKISQRIIWVVVLVTLLPSIYFGYNLVQEENFTRQATKFITNETQLTNDYLLNKKIDAKARKIHLVYGGRTILPAEIENMKTQLKKYYQREVTLDIQQGFAYLSEDNKNMVSNEQMNQLNKLLQINAAELKTTQAKLDSMTALPLPNKQIYSEIKAQYPSLHTAVIQPNDIITNNTTPIKVYLVLLDFNNKISASDKAKIKNWLRVRMPGDSIKLVFQ